MPTPFEELIIYLRVAQAFKNRLQMSDCDRALVMAGTCAAALQMKPLAEFCRSLVLQNNSGHMLRKYEGFMAALTDPDFGIFLKHVRRKLSPDKAVSELRSFDYECDVKQQDYATKMEFAAAVMGVDGEWLTEKFG